MDSLFNPKSVAVIGASDNPDKLGFHVLKSVKASLLPHEIFPVNPGKEEIMGIRTFSSLASVQEKIDLCIIALPPKLVPLTLKECVTKDVKGIDKAQTLNGQSVMVKVKDGHVMIDNAKVVTTDIICANGVIHVIDAVILPKTDNKKG